MFMSFNLVILNWLNEATQHEKIAVDILEYFETTIGATLSAETFIWCWAVEHSAGWWYNGHNHTNNTQQQLHNNMPVTNEPALFSTGGTKTQYLAIIG